MKRITLIIPPLKEWAFPACSCNIASSMAVEDALQFFVERRHLEPYLDGAFVEEPMDFNSLLDIALTNVLYDWVLAFIELAQQVRAELSAAGK